MTFKMEWYGEKVLEATNSVCAKVSKDIAEDVMEDAKRILSRKAKTKTEDGLLTQFSITDSKYKDGGSLVWCQGPGNWHEPYHASFVELGTPNKAGKRHGSVEAKPFMRPAASKNKRNAKRKFEQALDKL